MNFDFNKHKGLVIIAGIAVVLFAASAFGLI